MPIVASSLARLEVNAERAATMVDSGAWNGGESAGITAGVSMRTRALDSQIVRRKACIVAMVLRTRTFSRSDQTAGGVVSTGPEG
jgi:hypothetical protein